MKVLMFCWWIVHSLDSTASVEILSTLFNLFFSSFLGGWWKEIAEWEIRCRKKKNTETVWEGIWWSPAELWTQEGNTVRAARRWGTVLVYFVIQCTFLDKSYLEMR